MQLIKLDATDSTNDYLKSLVLSDDLDDFTVVLARNQLQGKGQMGARWLSEPGKNLTFSVLKKNLSLHITNQFTLNICVSLAILKTLQGLSVPDVRIKWPNDILSGTAKICGILIENILHGGSINTSIIGIGLNVNQLDFNTLQNVTSLKLLLGSTFNLDEILYAVLENLERVFQDVKDNGPNYFLKTYEDLLFRKDKPSTFEDGEGSVFMGFIRGVSKNGKLVLSLEDNIIKEFNLKEVKLLY